MVEAYTDHITKHLDSQSGMHGFGQMHFFDSAEIVKPVLQAFLDARHLKVLEMAAITPVIQVLAVHAGNFPVELQKNLAGLGDIVDYKDNQYEIAVSELEEFEKDMKHCRFQFEDWKKYDNGIPHPSE